MAILCFRSREGEGPGNVSPTYEPVALKIVTRIDADDPCLCSNRCPDF